LEELSASRQIERLECIGEQLEIGIFQRRPRGRWDAGAGHIGSNLTFACPRGGGVMQNYQKHAEVQSNYAKRKPPTAAGRKKICGILLQNKALRQLGCRKYYFLTREEEIQPN